MSQSKEVKYTSRSITPPPAKRSRSRSLSRSRGRSRSRSPDSGNACNPGNNLYVTGLSTRITSSDLEKYFSKEGKVQECHVVKDPRTRESRGFAFVTMDTTEDANRCVKYLNRSVLEGRIIKVEKFEPSSLESRHEHCIDIQSPIQIRLYYQGSQKGAVDVHQHLDNTVVQEEVVSVEGLVATLHIGVKETASVQGLIEGSGLVAIHHMGEKLKGSVGKDPRQLQRMAMADQIRAHDILVG